MDEIKMYFILLGIILAIIIIVLIIICVISTKNQKEKQLKKEEQFKSENDFFTKSGYTISKRIKNLIIDNEQKNGWLLEQKKYSITVML